MRLLRFSPPLKSLFLSVAGLVMALAPLSSAVSARSNFDPGGPNDPYGHSPACGNDFKQLHGCDPVDYVSTLVGTMSKHSFSSGNTYPATARPWGMNFWTPQTGKMGDGWIYTYTADKIRGLRQTHQPSPWINDYGQFAVMPVTGTARFDQDERASWFSHKSETATPYYYSVYLADHDVTAELTPTERAAAFRVTFPERDSSFVVVDAFDNGSYVRIDKERNRIYGYTTKNSGGVPDNFRNWFVVEFDRPFDYTAVAADGQLNRDISEFEGDHAMGLIGFPTRKGQQVLFNVASSFISWQQAEINLLEVTGRQFDEIVSEGRDRWNDVLGRIEVLDGERDDMRTFYSCLYRSLLFPRALHETGADGLLRHYSPYDGTIREGYMYTDTGFWDTFRSLFPLLNLLYPSVNTQIQEGLANTFLESGFLPEWASPGHRDCMVGNNSASVVADAYINGIRTTQPELLWQAVVHGTHNVHPQVGSTGRIGHEYYNELGYVPYAAGINENAARTLEYAYDDWTIWRLGRAMGKSAAETDVFARRAINYRNLFDPQTSLMRGRLADGRFQSPFNPLKWGDAFTEGNSWHYTWSVFHDPQGLIDLMGGRDRFNAMLDSVFNVPPSFDASYYGYVIHEIREMQVMNMGNYAHGNQPVQHMIYLYNYAGQPWKAQSRVREVMRRFYTCSPDGYCGDEDNGQTSAWYVFSSLGFYPVCPGSEQYVIGSPLFRKIRLNFEDGHSLTIEAPENGEGSVYIDRVTIDGRQWPRNYFTRNHMIESAKIRFDMAPAPNYRRGISPDAAPYSFSTDPERPDIK